MVSRKMLTILIMEIREIFAQNLKVRRRELKLSQEELAHLAELDRTYVSALERCKYAVSIDVIAKLATALSVSPAALLDEGYVD